MHPCHVTGARRRCGRIALHLVISRYTASFKCYLLRTVKPLRDLPLGRADSRVTKHALAHLETNDLARPQSVRFICQNGAGL